MLETALTELLELSTASSGDSAISNLQDFMAGFHAAWSILPIPGQAGNKGPYHRLPYLRRSSVCSKRCICSVAVKCKSLCMLE